MGSLSAPLHAQRFAHIDQLFFSKVYGGANPAPQVLTVTSTGSAFGFHASASTSSGGEWLAVSPTGDCCLTPAPVSVIVSASDALAAGSYSGQVVFTGGGTSLIVNVTLVVAPMGGAVFGNTPEQLSFSMKPGGQPPSQVMRIGNGGTGTLNWRLIGSTFNGANFLSVSAQTGTAPTLITLGVLPQNLPNGGATAGVYTGQVLFLAAGSTVTVPISVSVGDAELDQMNRLSLATTSPGALSAVLAGGANLWPANTINVICGGFGNQNTRSGAYTTAPDGTNTAPLIIEANPVNGSVPHFNYLYPDLGVGQQTLSFHFKAGGNSWVYIRSRVDGVEQRVWFNLVGNGAVGNNVPAGWTAQIAPAGNGWYRCAVTFNVAQSAVNSGFGLATSDQQVSYTASNVNGVYQWGQQFEHGTLTAYQANVGPCLYFNKTSDAISVVAGLPIGYTISLHNDAAPGTGAATAAAMNDPLPGGTGINWSISPAYGGPGACAITGAVGSQTLACNFGDMAGGGAALVHVTSGTSASSCAAYSNTATVSATNPISFQASATTTVQCTNLGISKTHTGNFTQGQNGATYSVTVSNATGAGPTSGTVTVTETVPSGLTLASMSGSNWNCLGNSCTRSDVLAPGSSYPAITVAVNVASNAPSLLTNQVTVSGGGSATASASDPTTVVPTGCTYTLTPPNTSISYSGGDGLTFGLTTSVANCAWTVTTPVGWLKALPDTGTGNGTIYYSVYPNYASVSRAASLVAGGQNFTITQAGAPGTPDERFVQLLYFNFYGRRPSAAEVAFQVTNGVGPVGRAQVALNFFHGQEFLKGGRFIVGLYFGLLGRAPDYNGFVFQRNAMARNVVDPFGLVTNVLNGAEFQLKYGTLTDTAFVTLLYNQILLRAPDQQGLIDQVKGVQLYGRTQIAINLLNSPEFQVTTGPQMSAYLLYACLLQRDATLAETNALVSQIQQGATFLSLISNFVTSAEFGQLLR